MSLSSLLRPLSVRGRLTMWNAAVIAAVLLVYATAVYVLVRHSLYEELDRQLRDELETKWAELVQRPDGGLARGSSDPRLAEGEVGSMRWFDVWTADGVRLHLEGPDTPMDLPRPVLDHSGTPDRTRTVTTDDGLRIRVSSARRVHQARPVLMRVARSEEGIRHELAELLVGIGLGLPTAVLLACLGGYFLAGRALRPVKEMATQATTITAERLSDRLPIENPHDELGRLGTAFNDTLARLEHSFDSLRRFTADAAHELRTPLTALRSVGEVALRESDVDAVDGQVVASMLEEVDRLASLVEALLMLSRADSGRMEVDAEAFDLRACALEAADYLEAVADEREQTIVVGDGVPVYALADRRLVRQALLNVLDNAVKYGPVGSEIRITSRVHAGQAVLDVVDQGPGISGEHRERVFERFYRVDQARSRDTGGAGLGLSIALWAVQANGGDLQVHSDGGTGSCFRMRLPMAEV